MAVLRDITGDDQVFLDNDKNLRYTVYQGKPTDAEILAGTAIPEDVAAYSLKWVLSKNLDSTTPLITKLSGGDISVTGIYDADPSANTQRVIVRLRNSDTYNVGSPAVALKSGMYVCELKRVDVDEETTLAQGKIKLLPSAARE